MLIWKRVLEGMIAHAKESAPREACGLLVGKDALVEEQIRCSNEAESTRRFSVPVGELFRAFRWIREQGKDLQGLYHSHPESRALPSSTDREEFYHPEASYWIVSLLEDAPVVGCFRWEKGNFEAVSYEILGGEGDAAPGGRLMSVEDLK